ncbi:PREDICTED: zinc finger BED domain-containing protein DAYSLEEPER-like isoform X1 [Ipomoea nil]|uniref:zinc finger BED domain-containing protein DAYSLEEPER-like isoform X1 n=1 Tax=Ipomoea nil TaxID=35883 RepID=UPI0009015FF8|nr:PREDICTED: zinc finger BED domain-containing protein DAYSLEEPER-like isoform X1 [Ipomoea nil]XP_019192920.1 PREDICTED: zinc finger BED domain-containing protein DAYSLEEPER-like isoform X1 [Ipomoea nil]
MTMVEHVGFRMFVRNLQPLFDIATFDGVEADCREIYLKERQKVYEELDKLPGKIGLSADTWTANGDAEYLCLTAHYIDDSWQVKKKILNFLLVDPSQTDGDMLSEVIMTSLRNWDIDRKLFSVTFDNHSMYEKIVWKIREQLCQHRFLLCNGQLFDIPCAANLIKMMVQDTLEKSCEILHKVRESIRYVQCSQSTQEKFNEMVQLVGINSQKCLCLDNTHQWNSTCVMLDAALEYKDVFLIFQEHDPHTGTSLSGVDWDRVSALTTFIKQFHEASSIFRGNKCNTANIYFPEICNIHLQLIEWCKNSDDFIHSLALKMKSRFDEYWKKCSLALAIAAILDPRFKLKLVEYYYPQIYGDKSQKCIDTVSDCMKALYTGHAIYSPLASHGSCDGSLVGTDSRDRLKGFDRFLHETSESQSDLDKYLEEPLFPRTVDFNILNWWKVHAPRYPILSMMACILSMMACNILGIPMSKVGPELMYSTGNRAVDSYRSPLRSDTLQALMCAQDWMHNDFEDAKAWPGSTIFALS